MVQDEGANDGASDDDHAATAPVSEGEDGAHHAERSHADDEDDDEAEADVDNGELDEQGLRQKWQELGRAYRRMERDPAMPASLVAQAKKAARRRRTGMASGQNSAPALEADAVGRGRPPCG